MKLPLVVGSDLPGGLAGLARRGLHLVLTLLNVILGQVTNVGDIHHLDDLAALIFDEAPQHIRE